MKLEHLRVLRAVVETGTVKSAAHSLNKTQPAISQSIQSLEFQIGAQLFDRSGYRLSLNPFGKRVYLQSLRILNEADGLSELVSHFDNGNEEQIAIALDANADMKLLLPLLQQLQTEFPETRVILKTGVLSGTIDMINEGSADLAIAPLLPVMLEEEGFDYKFLSKSKMCNVAAPGALDAISRTGELTDLRCFHQIIVNDTGNPQGIFDQEFGVQKGQRRWYVDDVNMKKNLLIAGAGWGRLPEHLILRQLHDGDLEEIALKNTHHVFDLNFYAFRTVKPAVRPVASFLWNCFENQQG